ncbi:minor capsid protein [Jeotgalibaca porci]|uniref:minor capsid protein n=1 Tax=Jeotgalibaca porci TaxID=1868793 RepID=UPI0035A1888F
MTKKETASEKYWNRRRELEDKALLNAENETIRELTTDIFPGALKKIQEKLLSQSNLHNMTQSELLENFSNRDQKKYRDYVNNNYQELMSSDKKYQEFIDEYFPPYDYAKINRLTQMRADIFSIMASEMIKSDVNQKFNTRLEDVVNKMYGSNSKALFQFLGTGEVHALPKKELEDILNYPWSGKTFSNRLWGNVSRLEQNLSLSIVNAATSGDGVLSVLKDMKGNDEISSMFKQEEGKFNRAIENLVRTEYAHFAVEGVKKSLDDAGIKDKQSWSAEDERVCSICGGRHGKIITDDWYPPYHGRCRCSLIPKMPELSEDIDEIYEEMFGSLLDEFAKDNFGINLTHPEAKKNENSLFSKTNMSSVFGESKYKDFLKQVESIPDERFKKILAKMEDEIEFNKTDKESFVDGSKVFLDEEAFVGSKNKKTMQVVIHELGHAIDNFGVNSLDTDFDRVSQIPQYRLKALIQKDLLNTFNNDLKLINGDAYEKVKSLKKMSIFDESAIVRKYKRLSEENPTTYSSLSDIMESTGVFVEYPLGHGHGLKYWKTYGNQEAEFFAHMTETLVNEDARKMMYEIFPEASKKWNSMIDDILKELD